MSHHRQILCLRRAGDSPFGVFRAADGWLAINAPEDSFTRGLFAAMDRPDLGTDDRFSTRDQRVRHADELHALIEAWTTTVPRDRILSLLDTFGVSSAPVRTPTEAVADPLMLERGDTSPLEHPVYGGAPALIGSGLPVHLSASATGFTGRVPTLGQDTDAVYEDLLGYDEQALTQLRAEGTI